MDNVFVKSIKPIAPPYALQTEHFSQNVHCNQNACSRIGLDTNLDIKKNAYTYRNDQRAVSV